MPADPNPNCLKCPSLLPATDSKFFNKSIGVPVCARFGKPVGRITSTNDEVSAIGAQFASTCSEYGKPRPAVPDWSQAEFKVTFPDPETIGVTPAAPELVNTCGGCKHFIRADIVATELGWTTSMCAAKGKLLLANRLTLEARHCEMKDFGDTRTQTTGLMYLPEYEDNFRGAGDPVIAFRKQQMNFVDPTEYETDRPVDPADEARGIRAWRKVSDPTNPDRFVHLPIYNPEHFPEDMRKKIPKTGDDEHPEDYVDHAFYTYKVAVLWMELDETPAFWGQAGAGKTEFFRYMAWLMQLPFERFSITGSTELDDLAGKTHYTEGVGTHFEKGRLVKAWEGPCVMVVDEPNAGQPDVWQFLRPMTDNSKQLVLDTHDGRTSDRDLDCYLGLAMNPAWDIRNTGVMPISDPDANRLMHIFIELPPETLEREIIKKRCEHDGWEIPTDTLDMVMKIAEDIRANTNENQTLPITWAIRPQLKVARALRWFDPIAAYKMASADFLEPPQQQILLDIVRTHAVDDDLTNPF